MKTVSIAVIIILVAGVSFIAGAWYHNNGPNGSSDIKPGATSADTSGVPVYAADEPGEPEAMYPEMGLGAVRMSPERRQLIGVKMAAVEKEPVTYALRLYGKVVPDETKTFRVNASTDCWIRELSEVTTGSIVQKDKVLAEALAPAFYNAQLSYVLALDNIDRIRRQLGGQVRHQQGDLADNQIRMAVQSMQNLGITDTQIEELARTRKAKPYLQIRAPTRGVVLSRNVTLSQWFKAGEEFYTIADLDMVWVYGDVYEDEAIHMKPGMAVTVKHAQMGRTFSAKVAEVLPLFDPTARTLKVRIDIDNPRYDLRPDMFVDVEIPITMRSCLNVPAEAVIDTGTQAIVYVNAGSGIFEPRRVETGWRLGGRVAITGGLAAGEKIAVSGNFLIDSESRMEIAALGSGVKISADPVCGRFVDAGEAEMFERIASHAGETFYFCSNECKGEFGKAPERYVRNNQKGREDGNPVSLPEALRSWADLLIPAKDSHPMGNNSNESAKGPYPFPGAQYLGTVPREQEPAEGEPPKDRLPPRQFEIPSTPPAGTRLK